jgi:hypothetical protein
MIDRSRVLGIAGLAAVLCAGAAWISLHSAQAAQPPAQSAAPAAVPPLAPAETIHDDPTVAPDPNQSADSNISLPSDI